MVCGFITTSSKNHYIHALILSIMCKKYYTVKLY